MFMQSENIEIESSDEWSNDSWYKNQDNRTFIKNEGMKIINEGEAEGRIIGGNLCTLIYYKEQNTCRFGRSNIIY